MLMNQYISVFSTKTKENISNEIFNQCDENVITNVEVTENTIKAASDKLKENSAQDPDGVPAIFLK